jgi:DNA-binding CsgD family transcriptional regulator
VARLAVAVQHHRVALGLPSPPVERIAAKRLENEIRAELSPARLATALLTGRGLRLDQATQLGLALLDSIAPAHALASSVAGPERLTRRETEVAQLIAQGLTNRQIAEDLVIAQRTVDTHVERILAKLGFGSRAQVAAWVVRQAAGERPVGQPGGVLIWALCTNPGCQHRALHTASGQADDRENPLAGYAAALPTASRKERRQRRRRPRAMAPEHRVERHQRECGSSWPSRPG